MTEGHPSQASASVSVYQVLKDPLTTEVLVGSCRSVDRVPGEILVGSCRSVDRVPAEVLAGSPPHDVENFRITLVSYHQRASHRYFACVGTISKVALGRAALAGSAGHFVCAGQHMCSNTCAPRKKPRATCTLSCGFMVGREGVEPSTLGLRVPCSTN